MKLKILVLLVLFIHTASAKDVIVILNDLHENFEQNLNKLKTFENFGKVERIKKLWIINGVALNATDEVIAELKKKNIEVIPDYRVKLLNSHVNHNINANQKNWGVEWIWVDKLRSGINGSGVRVAVVDTGIAEHPDLAGKIIAWKDFVNNFSYPYDDNGHGTHVAGIIAGNVTGVALGVKLIGVKVFDSSGSAGVSDVIAGFQWAAENNASVISYSGGAIYIDEFNGTGIVNGTAYHNFSVKPYTIEEAFKPATIVVELNTTLNVTLLDPDGKIQSYSKSGNSIAYTDYPLKEGDWRVKVESNKTFYSYTIYVVYESNGSSILDRAVNRLTDMGVVFVCAAGNEGYLGFRTINSPATASNSIAVGALSFMSYNVSWFSSRGPAGKSTIKPDLVAPGEQIYSTVNGGYGYMSGTSMATPHVSGVVALMLQVNSSLTPSDVKRILEETAMDLGEKGKDNIYGSGLVNAYYSVLNASIKGDLDLSGSVDIADVACVAYMVVGKIEPDLRADFNGNGRIDVGDLAKIAYCLLGKAEL